MGLPCVLSVTADRIITFQQESGPIKGPLSCILAYWIYCSVSPVSLEPSLAFLSSSSFPKRRVMPAEI